GCGEGLRGNCAGGGRGRVGTWVAEQRVGRENLKAASPEKPAAEIEAILSGVWDNLGRLAAEFAHLDRLWADDRQAPGAERVAFGPKGVEIFEQLRSDGKPALIFAA